MEKNIYKIGKELFITSDEEIKEVDWCLDIFENKIVQCLRTNKDSYWNKNCKKIILTTNQSLDGVQAIDDEFLEWFIKNTSCEEVEVERLEDGQYVDRFADGSVVEGIYENYKIIIPKEEPKQELELKDFELSNILDVLNMGNITYLSNGDVLYNPNLTFIKKGNRWFVKTDEPKQETLEEVQLAILFHNTYENLAPNFGYETRADTKSFETTTPNGMLMIAVCKEIIKWQQERMYSEVIEFAEWIRVKDFQTTSKDNWIGLDIKYYTTEELFEQFKKK